MLGAAEDELGPVWGADETVVPLLTIIAGTYSRADVHPPSTIPAEKTIGKF